MKISLSKTQIVAVLFGVAVASSAFAATPAADLGKFKSNSGQTISVTVALKLNDLAGAESMMQRLVTPGDAMYLKFLTPEQVERQFGPDEGNVAQVIANLSASGLTVQRATSTTLTVTGMPATFERVFQTSLHQFAVAATRKAPASMFRAAVGKPVVPSAIAAMVRGVIGLNTKAVYHTHLVRAPAKLMAASTRLDNGSSSAANKPEFFTVKDFAAQYNVNPLYAKGVTGKGRTLGIVTLASFTPSDAFAYWNSLGLKVKSNRLTVIDIDGGPGAPSDASGSDETTLDVEQSGGIAPGANIVVYQAPNTNQGFLDAFARAVHDNKVDSFSSSWGEWEFFDNLANGPVNDEFSGETVSSLQALHEVLVLAALQGQTAFASSGDSGAFDSFGEAGAPGEFSNPLSVDNPASDTAITAAGGTTLPGVQMYSVPTGALSINIPTERVWGWDYLAPLCNAIGLDFISCGIFPAGGGGGVSVFFPMPLYQLGIFGTQLSQPKQSFDDETTSPPTRVFKLPAYFPGRNVPDVSFNADPQTGYLLAYTSDGTSTDFGIPAGFSFIPGNGGTSFVAPQLNGVTALLAQNAGHRLGLLNVGLYNLARLGFIYGPNAAIHTISAGNNWFYNGRNGYNPGAGLGTIDVFNLSQLMR